MTRTETEKARVMLAMETILQYLNDEDLLYAWYEWGIEPDDGVYDVAVLLEDFDSICNDFARIVRLATRDDDGKVNYNKWLFIPEMEDK